MQLVNITDLTEQNIFAIWALSQQPAQRIAGNVGWSFEGNGIRTRTAFIQAFRQLGLGYLNICIS